MADFSAEAAAILHDFQTHAFTKHRRTRSMERLRELAKKDEGGGASFRAALFAHVNRLLLVLKREPAVEQLFRLVVEFATSPGVPGDEDMALALVQHVLAFSGAAEKAVRFRVCQVVGMVMERLSEDADVDEDLWEALVNKMCRCTRDKVGVPFREQTMDTCIWRGLASSPAASTF
eukprot:g4466.t1